MRSKRLPSAPPITNANPIRSFIGLLWRAQQHRRNDRQHRQRKPDQKNVAPRVGDVGQHPKSDAGVFGVHDIQQPGDCVHPFPQRHMRLDDLLSSLGRAETPRWQSRRAGSAGPFQSPSISCTASLHAAHRVGNSASWPTSVVYFQQRSHLSPSARSTSAASPLARPLQLDLRHDEQSGQVRPGISRVADRDRRRPSGARELPTICR